MTDLLVQRLKAAKRELTALKTAHRRGLGLLRVYEQTYLLADLGMSDISLRSVSITLQFSRSFSPYPFVTLVGQGIDNNAFWRSAIVESSNYTDNGFGIVFNGTLRRYDSEGLTKFMVRCTAPITSIEVDGI